MGSYHLFLLACAVLVIVPPVFVYHQVYHDGVIGRVALVGIFASASLVWLFHFFADDESGLPMTLMALLTSSFALFLCWHLFRFHARVLKENCGECEKRITCNTPTQE